MDLVQITLIIVSTYFMLSLIVKGGLMFAYCYFMYNMFKSDKDLENLSEPDTSNDYDYDEIPF